MALDVTGVLTDQIRGDYLMDMTGCRLRAVKRLAKPGDPLIGMHPDPEQVGETALD